jgi:uncharacterized protein
MSARKYGAWAVVAGASEGLGAAFAMALASRGYDLVLIARRADALAATASEIRIRHKVTIRQLALDLADAGFADELMMETAGLEIGVAIYNAAYSYVAPLLSRPVEDALRVVDVNIRGPIRFVHALAPGMVERKSGGIVLMSSLAGFQGTPNLAAYAASKAFNVVLGESLWGELRPKGVDVLVSCAGAIRTPGYQRSLQKEAPGILDADAVAETTLRALGHGPFVVPGGVNKLAAFVMRRMLPRSSAISIMQKSTAGLA